MAQIYAGKHLSHYAQVVLVDASTDYAIPEWDTSAGANELFVADSSGLAIATASNTKIEIFVCTDVLDVASNLSKIGECDIMVGGSGIIVGDFTTNSTAEIPYCSGSVHISIYTNNIDSQQVTTVALLMK